MVQSDWRKAALVLTTVVLLAVQATQAGAASRRILTPQVVDKDVHDQSTQSALSGIGHWASSTLGLTDPTVDVYAAGFMPKYGWFKKVEVIFTLTGTNTSMEFGWKQQWWGDITYSDHPEWNEHASTWTQDGPFPYEVATDKIDALSTKRLFLHDMPGFPSDGTTTGPGYYATKYFACHFRDKVKWGSKDVYRNGDPDPYFGFWQRGVSLWSKPGPPPDGTNNHWSFSDNY